VKGPILRQVVPVSTPFLLGLVLVLGALGIWYFRARSARDSKRASAASKARNNAVRSAQSVQAALRGRR
jgi:Tfp pilus assembly protein PilX